MAAENRQEGDPASVLQPLLKGIVSGTLRLGSENVCRTPVVASPRCICTCFICNREFPEDIFDTDSPNFLERVWRGYGKLTICGDAHVMCNYYFVCSQP